MTKKRRAATSGKRSRKTKEIQEQEEPEEYHVESILDHRTNDKGEIEYLIRWVGYDETTWEPKDNCACHELIEAYEKGIARKRELDLDSDREEGTLSSSNRSKLRKISGYDSGSETEEETPQPKPRSNGTTSYKELSSDEEDIEVKKDDSMVLDRSIASKDITMDDSDDSLDYSSKYYNKENDVSKIIPEFEVEEEEDPKTDDKFDRIVKRTAITSPPIQSSTRSNENFMVAEKILKAGLTSDGLTFLVKIEGLDEPQSYGATDAYKLFPQQVISYYQTRIRWE